MSEVVVYAQADAIGVRLELAPAGAAAELETLVLRAVLAGVDELDKLADVFGLTPRITADLLGDLWMSGLITVDLGMTRETIRVSEEGRSYLATGAEGRGSVRRSSEVTTVLLERLTGRVLAERAQSRPLDRRMIVPLLAGDRDPRQVRLNELGDAVARGLDADRGQSLEYHGHQRIESIRPVPVLPELPVSRRYVPLRLEVWKDDDLLRVRLAEQPIREDLREYADVRLQAFIRSNPNHEFVTALRSLATAGHPGHIATFDEQFDELARLTKSLSDVDQGVRQQEHERAKKLASALLDRSRAQMDREMDVEVISTESEHRVAINKLIDSAERQLVLAVPKITIKRINEYRPSLERAVARGVRVFFVWGLDGQTSDLDERVKQAFYAISRHRRRDGGDESGGARFATTPAHIHAKLVIADDRSALVTSKNYLSQSDLAELGVVVSARDQGRAPTIEELLVWAAELIPDYGLGRGILRSATEFDRQEIASNQVTPAFPRLDSELVKAAPGDPRVVLWAEGWRSVAAEIAASMGRPSPVVRLYQDDQHHELIRSLMSRAKQRMVVTSHRVSAQLVHRDLASRAIAARERGATLEFLYGELSQGTTTADLEELSDTPEPSGGVPIRQREKNHAKVLVADEVAVVGSFNYLSFEGVSRKRMSSEISLEITSAEVSNRIAEALGARVAPIAATPERAVPRLSSAAVDAAASFAENDRAGLVEVGTFSQFVRPEQTAAVLEVLRLAGSAETLERFLWFLAAGASGPTVDRLLELAQLAVDRADWEVALAFRQAIPTPTIQPTARFLEVAAAPTEELVLYLEAAEGNVGQPEHDALAVHAAACYLVAGRSELGEALRAMREAATPSVAALIDQVLRHGHRFGEIDIAALREDRQKRRAAELAEAGWLEFAKTVDDLRNVKQLIHDGRKTIDFVFSEGQEFDRALEIIRARELNSLSDWYRQYEADDQRWLVDAAHRAGAVELVGKLRTGFTTKRRATRVAAMKILDAAEASPSTTRGLLDGERESAEGIVKSAHELLSAHVGSTASDALFARALHQLALDPIAVDPRILDVWRLPRYRRLVDTGPADRARLAALDLLEIRSPEDALNTYLHDPDLSAAASFIQCLDEKNAVDVEVLTRLRRSWELERDRRVEQLQSRVARIAATAERLGTPVEELRIGMEASEPDEDTLSAVEADLKHTEELRVQEIATVLNSREDIDDSLREYVEGLIRIGEYNTALDDARRLHRAPASDFAPPPAFRWNSLRLREVVNGLTRVDERPPGFADFVPTEDDSEGQRVITALAAMAAGADGAIEHYVAAVQALVSPSTPQPRIVEGTGGPVARFEFPAPYGTSSIKWADNSVVDVAIGTSESPALFRLATDMDWRLATEMERGPWGATITIGDILSLMYLPDPANRLDLRQLRLHRLVASRLDFDEVLGRSAQTPGASAISPEHLRRLLYILGVDLTQAEREALKDMLEEHPYVLWRVVEAIKKESPAAISFSDRRATPSFDLMLSELVAKDLGSAGTVVVLAAISEWGERSGATREEIEYFVRESAQEATTEPLPVDLELVTIEAELQKLTAARYVEQLPDGRYRMINKAPWYALRRTFANDRSRGWFTNAVHRMLRTARTDYDQQFDAELYRHLLHDVRGIIVDSAGADEREVQIGIDDLKDPDVPVSVKDLITVVQLRFERQKGSPDIEFFIDAPDVDDAIKIKGPYVLLYVALWDALHNSVNSIRDSRARGRSVESGIHLGVTVSDSAVTFTVIDRGEGFPAEILNAFSSGREAQTSGASDHGHGLKAYRLLASHAGPVELGNRDRGGARVRFTVPRVDADVEIMQLDWSAGAHPHQSS
ncbi:ATP-binding protein [Leifsonia sp. EB34]|uniref:ATP-binding protein n=1 Tax=Leifsonia sp. EB34 TaxID=3156303 RepID=UPI0035110F50